MHARFIGGILLIIGTSIGGGMLALPAATAAAGFWASTGFLILCWLLMTLGAFFTLEVNLYLPPQKNMSSMAYATLGQGGLLITWLVMLLLLYVLLSGYISGGADVLGGLLQQLNIHCPEWQCTLFFTIIFGSIVYQGIRAVDLLNRGLMFAKLSIYFVLTLLITPHIDITHYQHGQPSTMIGSIMILMTSFGYAIIIPNLREYFNDDIPTLKRVIFIGSLIPLLCYIFWDAVIIGSLPTYGEHGLISLMHDPHATSQLAVLISQQIQNPIISSLFNGFISICMLTAFLGVALCMLSFLSDGLNLQQRGAHGFVLSLLTFGPPLLIVIFYPNAYMYAMNYAGYCCVVLLLLLPALMSFFGRARFNPPFKVWGGKAGQILVILSSVLLLILVR